MHQEFASQILLHMSLIDGVGSQACATLCEVSADNLHELYMLNVHELHKRTGLSFAICDKISSGLADKALLDRELALIEKHKISFLTILDPEYPQLLRHIHTPPAVLYYQGGSLSQLSPALAFVGSRKADTYGAQATAMLIPEIVKEGFTTISGGALGIDGMVHRETLKAGGKTVAILGSGLLKPYPSSHKTLFEEIIYSGGLVMSSFPLTFEPLPQNFPARNRIIAGLSSATIVIQAAVKSGALLTARNALDEGRDVGVVPGSVFNELSAGCHELLVHGARPITKSQDIFELIGHQAKTLPAAPVIQKSPRASVKSETPAPLILSLSKGGSAPKVKEISRDPLLALCTTPKSTDDLLMQAGYSYDILQDRLWQLQIEGKLEQNMLGQWQAL
jgi:DNA processing protein